MGTADKAARQRARVAMYNDNRLKIGLFGANCSSGRAVTKVAERWLGSWEECLRLGVMADEAGIDFMLPIARWKGYGGDTDYQGTTLETMTWATGLLAKTRRITVLGTVHAPLFHPIVAAKQMVTADLIGEGRFGLNLVCGSNEGEFEMFGVTMKEHDQRYEYAQEWLSTMEQMWMGGDDFDFDGKFIKLKKVRAKPKPYGGTRPLIMNAAMSPVGQAFAVKNCDALFSSPTAEGKIEEFSDVVTGVKALARQHGREIGVYTVAVVCARATKKEAEDYYQYAVLDNADWTAVDSIIELRLHRPLSSIEPKELERIRNNLAAGRGGLPIIGDADYVAQEFAKLSAAGIAGIGLSLLNYERELPFFCDEVLPRLKRMGLRA